MAGSLGGVLGRYLAVSVINVVNHQLLLQLAVRWWGWSGGAANAFAAVVAVVPAYFLSRHWVWRVSGRSSLRAEVVPFWLIALAGLVVSTVLTEGADRLWDEPLLLSAASLVGYFIVWVVKFLLLNVLFGRARRNVSDEPQAAPV